MKLGKIILILLASGFSASQSVWAQNCAQGAVDESENPITIMKNKTTVTPDTEAYQYSVTRCSAASHVADKSVDEDKLPKDEMELGLYSMYRASGDSPNQALNEVNEFMAQYN